MFIFFLSNFLKLNIEEYIPSFRFVELKLLLELSKHKIFAIKLSYAILALGISNIFL